MDSIVQLFALFAKVGVIVVIGIIVALVVYFRWRAAGQERGI